jgi:hypothetical protein
VVEWREDAFICGEASCDLKAKIYLTPPTTSTTTTTTTTTAAPGTTTTTTADPGTTTTTTTAAPSNCYGVSLGYSSTSICDQDTAGVYYLDDVDLCLATAIHTDTFCTQLAPSGYYTYANGLQSRQWNGSSFVGGCQACNP